MLKLEEVRNLGWDAEEVLPQVFMIRDFIDQADVAALMNEAQSYTEEDWNFRYINEMKKHALDKFGTDDLQSLVDQGLLEVTDDFADKNMSVQNHDILEKLYERSQPIFDLIGGIDVTGFLVFQRLYEGTQLKSHFDQYSDKLVQWAAVLYINDDYTEGELFFPKFDNFSLRPPPGALVIFPGTQQYEHGVHPVGPGPVRYVLPAFIKTHHPDGAMAGWGDFG